MKMSAILRAIRQHARYLKRGIRTPNEQADAIIALAMLGSEIIRKQNEKRKI
jgi:hypothetical protein